MEQNQMELDRYPEMKRILDEYGEIESKPSDDRVGSTQIEQNQRELDRYPATKLIREIESKPSDDRVGSPQIEQNQRELDRYPATKRIREIESKPSDDRVGSPQIEQNQRELDRNPATKRIREIESKPSNRVPFSEIYKSPESRLRRIRKEYRQMKLVASEDYKCVMLKRNPSQWHYGFRGPVGTDYEGGFYHGLIHLPEEYPLKPPSFMFLTENGRFKTQSKIRIRRLDDWQPSWTVRDALLALIDEMSTYPDGELGSVDYNKEERLDLAIKSRAAAPKYGTSERQEIIDEIHKYLLSKSPPVPQLQLSPSQNDGAKRKHGTGGGSVGNSNVIGNIILAVNSNRVGVVDSINGNSGEGDNPKKPKRFLFWR